MAARVTRQVVSVLSEGSGTARVTRQVVAVLSEVAAAGEHLVEAESTLALAQEAAREPIQFSAEAESTLVLDQDITGEVDSKLAESTLVLDQDVTVQLDPGRQPSNELTLSQEATAAGPITRSASSALDLTQQAYVPQQLFRSAQSPIVLNQDVGQFGPKPGNASSQIDLAQEADTQIKQRSPSSVLTLDQDVQFTLSKLAKSTLNLTQAVDRSLRATGVSQLLDLRQEAVVPWDFRNRLTLTQEATVERLAAVASNLLRSRLLLTQVATAGKSLGLAPASILALKQAVSYYIEKSGVLCDYSPFIGAGDGDTPAASISDPFDPTFTKGLQLRYPSGASPVDVVTIKRSMNFGDIERFGFDRVNRETRGGTLIVFANPNWPKYQSLVFTISAVTADTATAVLAFLDSYLGRRIGLLTHEGRLWSGVITNPSEAVIQDHRDSYTISIEFEGEEE